MPPVSNTKIYDLASSVLASVASRMTAAGDPPPDRRYVHAGEVAFDCEELVVSATVLDHAFPGESPQMHVCAPPRHVVFEVWLIRCAPVQDDHGNPPSVAELDAAAAQVLTDMWVLPLVLYDGLIEHDWGGIANCEACDACDSVLFSSVEAVGPEGAFGGVKATLAVLVA